MPCPCYFEEKKMFINKYVLRGGWGGKYHNVACSCVHVVCNTQKILHPYSTPRTKGDKRSACQAGLPREYGQRSLMWGAKVCDKRAVTPQDRTFKNPLRDVLSLLSLNDNFYDTLVAAAIRSCLMSIDYRDISRAQE